MSTIRYLIENGADFKSEGSDKIGCPLYAAYIKSHEDVVKLLIDFGADPNLGHSNTNSTPVMVAAQNKP